MCAPGDYDLCYHSGDVAKEGFGGMSYGMSLEENTTGGAKHARCRSNCPVKFSGQTVVAEGDVALDEEFQGYMATAGDVAVDRADIISSDGLQVGIRHCIPDGSTKLRGAYDSH